MIDVHRFRTTVHKISLGFDVSGETIRSEIRETSSPTSALIATWEIEVIGGGSTGELRLSLDNSVTKHINHKIGYMDILRESGGEPYSVLDDPIQVCFKDFPTRPSVE